METINKYSGIMISIRKIVRAINLESKRIEKDYGLSISSKQVGFSVFKNAAENALYKICKNFKPKSNNLKYLITDTNGKILKNSSELKLLLKNTNWKKLQK